MIDNELLKEVINDVNNNPNSCMLDEWGRTVISDTLSKLFNYLYNNNLIDINYLNNDKLLDNKKISDYTLENIYTKLTFILRWEKFNPGLIYYCYKSGDLLKYLIKIYDIQTKNLKSEKDDLSTNERLRKINKDLLDIYKTM